MGVTGRGNSYSSDYPPAENLIWESGPVLIEHTNTHTLPQEATKTGESPAWTQLAWESPHWKDTCSTVVLPERHYSLILMYNALKLRACICVYVCTLFVCSLVESHWNSSHLITLFILSVSLNSCPPASKLKPGGKP